MITQTVRRTPQRERNLCVILGCLMEKLGGPSSVTILSDTTLSYLIGNLVRVTPKPININLKTKSKYVCFTCCAGRRYLPGRDALLADRPGEICSKNGKQDHDSGKNGPLLRSCFALI